MIAYPIVLFTLSAMIQKMLSGKDPESIQDLVAPRTGGVVPSYTGNVEERMMIPGSHKDWLGWWYHGRGEAWNKMHRGIHIISELATGQDWRGDPISTDQPGSIPWLQAYFDHVTKNLQPIAVQQLTTKRGSKIPNAMRWMGFREAPMYLENPEGYERFHNFLEQKAQQRKTRHENTERNYKGIVE